MSTDDTKVISVPYGKDVTTISSYYEAKISDFLEQGNSEILGFIGHNAKTFDINALQQNSWEEEIAILKEQLSGIEDGYIAFEYSIPRMGKRVDVVVMLGNYVFLLEFKCGSDNYYAAAKEQVENYALDLHNFHEKSFGVSLFPVLVCTEADNKEISVCMTDDVSNVICSNGSNLREIFNYIIQQKQLAHNKVIYEEWLQSRYKPTPTIIEAAQALYCGHSVKEISHAEGDVDDIYKTTEAVNKIIEQCKKNHEKAICFITGVPGAGKTLVGLNVANQRHSFEEGNDEHAIYLSGNGPLVKVLQEALAKDQQAKQKEICNACKEAQQNNCDTCSRGLKGFTLAKARAKTKSFIQIVHTFRDESIKDKIQPPIDKIAIFDEAQRAWDKHQLVKFMRDKKNQTNYDMSEPECFIEYLNRHEDWACIICLVGGGQEINVGEAGIREWFRALNDKFQDWHVYCSDQMTEKEYVGDDKISELLCNMTVPVQFINSLHLSTSKRSYRSNMVSAFVKALIDYDVEQAKSYYDVVKERYPIKITRNLSAAKQWVKQNARGNDRYGIVASSQAKRLRADGISWLEDSQLTSWFLNGKNDVNSSYFMEVAASEFDIQGLEIDWIVFAWEGDYRVEEGEFTYNQFKGTKWQKIKNENDKEYLKNSYRVLLTRARQGIVIYVPKGNDEDETRLSSFYDQTFEYLQSIGIPEI